MKLRPIYSDDWRERYHALKRELDGRVMVLRWAGCGEEMFGPFRYFASDTLGELARDLRLLKQQIIRAQGYFSDPIPWEVPL